jgi:hypothetical protein
MTTMKKRSLTEGEIELAKGLFGDSIDYSVIRLDNKYIWPVRFQKKNRACTYCNHVSCPGTAYSPDFSQEKDPYKQSVFIHELAHVWQQQNRILDTRVHWLREMIDHKLNYERTYLYGVSEGRDLLMYNFEQQASIIQDYFLLTRHGLTDSYKSRRRDNLPPHDTTLLLAYEKSLENFLRNPSYITDENRKWKPIPQENHQPRPKVRSLNSPRNIFKKSA